MAIDPNQAPLGRRFATAFGEGARPTSGFTRGGGQVEYRWSGNKILEALSAAANRALQRASNEAKSYWSSVIWTPANHPYMTGKEREAGRFVVFAGGDQLRPRLVGYVDLTDDYPRYEEFGTRFRPGHYPLRRTMDWIAPRIRRYIAQEFARETRGGGR